jgi:hypothetical protein
MKQYWNFYVDIIFLLSEFHDQEGAKWIVIRGHQGVIMIRPVGGQPPAGLSAARGWTAHRAYLVVLLTINYCYNFSTLSA